MDSLCSQQICGRSIATLPPKRLLSAEEAAAFRAGWYASPRRIQVPTLGRTSGIHSTTGIQGAGARLEQGRSAPALSSGGTHRGHGTETNHNQGTSSTAHPGLATSALASSCDPNRIEGNEATASSSRGLGGAADIQSGMATTTSRSEPRVTRSARRTELATAGAERIRDIATNSASAARSAELVADYAWSDRKTASRNSQWRTWMQFCESEGRAPIPVTEAHMVSFVGWLALERQAGRRSVASTSLPQYFSAVRQTQLALTGVPVPQFPFLAHVVRGYERGEGEIYPQPTIRMGIDATTIQRIWDLGMTSSVPAILRDAAVCVFAYCFNGLRESSVLSIQTENVEISDTGLTVRLSLWKGKRADRLQLIRYHRLSTVSSPLDLWRRWHTARTSHVRFFALAGEPTAWSPQGLTRSLHRVLEILSVAPPQHGKFTSHSLRIGKKVTGLNFSSLERCSVSPISRPRVRTQELPGTHWFHKWGGF